MKNKTKTAIVILILIAITVVLTWSPWLGGSKKLHDRILLEKGSVDGTLDENGELICDYKVMIFPFGRWVGSCEGGYYITFWGRII
ncbi:MAG: hypothetical protein WC845_03790 [Candidatus Staskawiczbacteria bacterium]|jgi:hypothetical protein